MSQPADQRRGIAKRIRLRPQIERLESRQLLASDLAANYDSVSASWYQKWDLDRLEVASMAAGQTATEWFSQFVGPRRYTKGDWIVRLSEQAVQGLESVQSAVARLNQSDIHFQVVAGLGLTGLVQVRSLSLSEQAVRDTLSANDAVVSFSKNERVSGQILPNDSDFGNMTNLHNVGQFGATNDADIDAPEAWDVTRGSTSVVVGVIDSGVDPTHPDLYLNIWLNQGEIPETLRTSLVDTDGDGLITFYDLNASANSSRVRDRNANSYIDAADLLDDPLWADGRDTDGNGFTDDFFGWNFRNDANEVFAPNNPSDNLGHGTHVAGTIGAVGNNARGVTGVNWRSSIMSLKFLDETNQGELASAIAAVNYATMMRSQFQTNVRVLNNSWGQPGGFNPLLKNTIDAAGNAGILFVAAAGNGNILGSGVDNDRNPFYPASYESDNIISVAASDATDRLAPFSNFGLRSVDIAAPGVGVRSTLPGGRYGEANGTSMATPHVAGAAALVWSLQTNATVNEVKRALLEFGDTLPVLGSSVGSGRRLNANKSLAADVFAPTVQLVSAANIITAGGTDHLITVRYTNRLGVDRTSLGNNDVIVKRQAALDETLTTTFVSSTGNANNTEVTAIYRLAAVGGSWDAEDFGNYSITVQADAARSTSGLPSRQAEIGQFTVRIAAPGIFYVNTTVDSVDANPGNGSAVDSLGRTSLRAAIMEAAALAPQPVKIFMPEGRYVLSIAPVIDPGVVFPVPPPGSGYDAPAGLQWSNGSTGDLDLRGNVTLVGLGVNRTTIDAAGIDRVMKVYPGATVSMTGLTITGGVAPTNHSGGGILNSGNLSLDLVTIKNNEAMGGPVSLGGGIAHWNGNLNIYRTTLDSNKATGGGGVFITNGATANIDSSTLSENVADGSEFASRHQLGGGGLLTRGSGRVSVENSTFSNNLSVGEALGDAIRNSSGVGDGDIFPVNISGDGNYLAMAAFYRLTETSPTPFRNIYLYNRHTGDYELVNRSTDGSPANGESILFDTPSRSVSWDGRYVVYRSFASNLVPNDNNDTNDIFVYDRIKKSTTRVALSLSGNDPNEISDYSSISGDGRFVFFTSLADNLVEGDTNGTADVFRYEVETGVIQLVSSDTFGVAVSGDNGFGVSSYDGRLIAFQSDGLGFTPNDLNGGYDIFVKDMNSGFVERVSNGVDDQTPNSGSFLPMISGNGRFVVFHSLASNLVQGDTNNVPDVFMFDRITKETRLLSKGVDGSPANARSLNPEVSETGRYVVFNSEASNLVDGDTNERLDYFWVDTEANRIQRIPLDGPIGSHAKATISGDGRYVSFTTNNFLHNGAGDSDFFRDSFVFDTVAGTLKQESPRQGNDITWVRDRFTSGNNRWVVKSDLVPPVESSLPSWAFEVTLTDLVTGATKNVSRLNDIVPNHHSHTPSVDDIGRFVVYTSEASNLVTDDTNGASDLFLADMWNSTTIRIASADPNNKALTPLNPRISGNGKTIVFESAASHLAPDASNNETKVFFYDVPTGILRLASKSPTGTTPDGASRFPFVSGDGKHVGFVSLASNLVIDDNNGIADLFVYSVEHNEMQVISRPPGPRGAGGGIRLNRNVASLNYDGSRVVFESSASDLVADDTNNLTDIFLWERNSNILSRINVGDYSQQANNLSGIPSISNDGRYVGYLTMATNIVETGNSPHSRFVVVDTYTSRNQMITSSGSEYNNSFFSMESTVELPRFTGESLVSLTSAGALIHVDVESSKIIAFNREKVPKPVLLSVNFSTLFSDKIPDRSIGLELLDGDMLVTNSAVSKTSREQLVRGSAFRNLQHPIFLNTSFVPTNDFGPLAANGGPTFTRSITGTSVAFHTGSYWNAVDRDQRGRRRVGTMDAGGFEVTGTKIRGRVFNDLNGNEIFDPDEVGVFGAEVFIDVNRDGNRSEEEVSTLTLPDDLTTVSANESGEFWLDNVEPGYAAVVATENGVTISKPSRGVDQLPTDKAISSWAVSHDGRMVAFASDESDLVVNDSNGVRDVFLWNRTTGEIKRVNITSGGGQSKVRAIKWRSAATGKL